MGKKGKWFVSVKKALSPESKEKKDQRTSNSKNKWGFGKPKHFDPSSSTVETVPSPPSPPPEEVKLAEAENEQSKHAYSVALVTAAAAEAAVAAAQAAAEVVRLTTVTWHQGKSKEEVAAIKIQTAFRGFLARKALRALRGVVRLEKLIQGQSVKRQTTTTLRCMQTLTRVQSQIHSRRIGMLEENQALQRQLQLNREKDLENLRASMGEDWDDSIQSKEEVEANLLSKQDAVMRRERALAYAYSRQQMWKNSSLRANPMFMDPNNPQWGWSWLDRWMTSRPLESRSVTDKEPNDHSSVKSASRSNGKEISKAYASREVKVQKPSPLGKKPNRQSPSTHPNKEASSSSVAGKLKSASPKGSVCAPDDDLRSLGCMQSEQYRRHSIGGTSVRDDESLASSPAVRSYMTPTESARAKARLQSPLSVEKDETINKGSVGPTKKRLSFPASPAGPRRHSGPPKVDNSSVNDVSVHTEQR